MVTNNGPSLATDVSAIDSLPPEFGIVSVSDDGVQAGPSTVIWHLGTLATGELRTRTVTVRVPSEAGSGTNYVPVKLPLGGSNCRRPAGRECGHDRSSLGQQPAPS